MTLPAGLSCQPFGQYPHHMEEPLKVKILIVSDGVIHGTRENVSGPALEKRMMAAGWIVVEKTVTADGTEAVAQALRSLAENFHGLIDPLDFLAKLLVRAIALFSVNAFKHLILDKNRRV